MFSIQNAKPVAIAGFHHLIFTYLLLTYCLLFS
nr:MAG TPA: hypothetical protein [Caudoviricetes sp.]